MKKEDDGKVVISEKKQPMKDEGGSYEMTSSEVIQDLDQCFLIYVLVECSHYSFQPTMKFP